MEALAAEAVARATPGSALARRLHLRELMVRIMKDPSVDFVQMIPAARQDALALGELGDDLGEAEAWFLAGRLSFDAGRLGDAREALDRAVALAEAAGHRFQLARAITVLAWTFDEGLTPVDEAIARLEELRRRAGGDRSAEAAVDLSTAFHHALAGRIGEARRLVEVAEQRLEDLGARFLLITFVSTNGGRIELLAADPEAAEARVRGAYLELEAMGNTGFLSSRAAFLALVLPELGRDEEALEFADIAERTAAKDDIEPQVWLREGRAKALSRRGEHGEAERMAREAVAVAGATEWQLRHADALVTLAGVLDEAGRGTEAAEALRSAIDLYDRKGATLPADQARARLETLRAR